MYTRKKLSQLPFNVPLHMVFKKHGLPQCLPQFEIVAEVVHIIQKGNQDPSLEIRMIALQRNLFILWPFLIPAQTENGLAEVGIRHLQSATPLDPHDLPLLLGWEKRWPLFEDLLSGGNTAKLTTAAGYL